MRVVNTSKCPLKVRVVNTSKCPLKVRVVNTSKCTLKSTRMHHRAPFFQIFPGEDAPGSPYVVPVGRFPPPSKKSCMKPCYVWSKLQISYFRCHAEGMNMTESSSCEHRQWTPWTEGWVSTSTLTWPSQSSTSVSMEICSTHSVSLRILEWE